MSKFSLSLVFLSLVLGIFPAHYFLNSLLAAKGIAPGSLLHFHLFLFPATVFIAMLVGLGRKLFPEKEGFAYMFLMLLKMVAAILVLWPYLQLEKNVARIHVFHFFAVYLLYLLVEVIFLVAVLQLTADQPQKRREN